MKLYVAVDVAHCCPHENDRNKCQNGCYEGDSTVVGMGIRQPAKHCRENAEKREPPSNAFAYCVVPCFRELVDEHTQKQSMDNAPYAINPRLRSKVVRMSAFKERRECSIDV